jgi:thioredoxin 1
MAPVFERLAREYTKVVFVKIDVEELPEIQRKLGVWALPTFSFLRFGHKQGSFMGASERKLRDGLENNGYVSICSSCTIL